MLAVCWYQHLLTDQDFIPVINLLHQSAPIRLMLPCGTMLSERPVNICLVDHILLILNKTLDSCLAADDLYVGFMNASSGNSWLLYLLVNYVLAPPVMQFQCLWQYVNGLHFSSLASDPVKGLWGHCFTLFLEIRFYKLTLLI